MRDEVAHGGVEEGVTGLAGDPALQTVRVGGAGAQVGEGADEGGGFDGGFGFELLDEVAVPMQAGDEGFEGAGRPG
jgi:hypothetical protein